MKTNTPRPESSEIIRLQKNRVKDARVVFVFYKFKPSTFILQSLKRDGVQGGATEKGNNCIISGKVGILYSCQDEGTFRLRDEIRIASF